MAFRDNATDDDGEPTAQNIAGALLIAEFFEIARAFYRAHTK